MTFSRADADVFVPDGGDPLAALRRTTHLCVAAHQDDIEIMAHAAIAECHGRPDRHFTGVVATDGAGAPRSGPYAEFTDEQMRAVRREEQRRAAVLGRYNLQLQLGHPSADVKAAAPAHAGVRDDLLTIFAEAPAPVVYLHNPADKHDTHVALFGRCLEALRSLPASRRPHRVLGCEVWRDLDWLADKDKVALDASARPELAAELLRAFDSQIAGGKRYDLATLGRRAANATFHTSHQTDRMTAITWAMDLSPLVRDPELEVQGWLAAHLQQFQRDVMDRLIRCGIKPA